MRLSWLSDPGHGWLAVPITDLEALGIADKISRYSFKHEATAYLEEDCDASLYLSALKASGVDLNALEQSHTFLPHDAPCRDYPRFAGPK
jgi:hypothetical protein